MPLTLRRKLSAPPPVTFADLQVGEYFYFLDLDAPPDYARALYKKDHINCCRWVRPDGSLSDNWLARPHTDPVRRAQP